MLRYLTSGRAPSAGPAVYPPAATASGAAGYVNYEKQPAGCTVSATLSTNAKHPRSPPETSPGTA